MSKKNSWTLKTIINNGKNFLGTLVNLVGKHLHKSNKADYSDQSDHILAAFSDADQSIR